ncbi:SapC family protein [Sphingomonas aracearum]|uniref:Multidrug transporter n=1 Tax=Sphingomonas aracearum TaxID=2283317 RepID=A0A369W0L5_9SPHN|nr:SapC family protein [Sphingomonas aracearum]RDE06900.1 multidrug transporter [Sphingomonas aracearum]
MASAPNSQLPLFYNALEPLSSDAHANYRLRPLDKAPFLAQHHAVPVTVDEFSLVQRHLPIVFTVGDDAVPIALMGLNEGVNTFVDDEGALIQNDLYVPAYIRRYPFMLARLRPDAQELSLCFDPTSGAIGAFEEGEALFNGSEPSETTRNVLAFNESFEQAGARTASFMQELRELDLLMEGEVTIQPNDSDRPFVYRGFQMVNEEKLQNLRGDQLRKIHQSGLLPLVYAHLFSLSLIREVFARQAAQGKMPLPTLAPVN